MLMYFSPLQKHICRFPSPDGEGGRRPDEAERAGGEDYHFRLCVAI